jgi:LPXTG-motif cell wall-anchored protein
MRRNRMMKKVAPILVAALALMVIFRGLAFAHEAEATMMEENNSGQNGMAEITDMGGGMLMVTIEISSSNDTPQPAHIHMGQCGPTLNPRPAYPLTSVVNGHSETMIEADVDELTNGNYAINVHKSAAEASVYVSCGNLIAASDEHGTVGMPRTGSSDQMFTLAALGLLALSITGVGLRLKFARRKA